MDDLKKLKVVDEFFDSYCNLSSLWKKVGHLPEAQQWLREAWWDYAEQVEDVEGIPFQVALANKGILDDEWN